jgi:uncharacterized SAM-binding protein YcdF (DUF218 family)
MDVIVYLGAQNDAHGTLDEMAQVRVQGALDAYRACPGSKLLITGGYGAFNPAPLPHARYVVRHLLALGVPECDLLPIVESRHTVEDAALSHEALASLDAHSVHVVTSEFHVPRARLIFSCFYDPAKLSFVATPNCVSGERLQQRLAHEQKSIALIQQQSGIIYRDTLYRLP